MMKFFLSGVQLVFVVSLFAGNTDSEQPTLSQQFQSIREQAEVIENYRMLKAYQVENFWKSVTDTLQHKDELIAGINSTIASQEEEMKSLKASLQEQEAKVAESEHANTHISVLGLDVTKTGFIRLFILVVVSLVVVIALAAWVFKISHRSASDSRNLYDEVSKEFAAYKHKMVEKEVKLLRELQDHRNRLTELKSA